MRLYQFQDTFYFELGRTCDLSDPDGRDFPNCANADDKARCPCPCKLTNPLITMNPDALHCDLSYGPDSTIPPDSKDSKRKLLRLPSV